MGFESFSQPEQPRDPASHQDRAALELRVEEERKIIDKLVEEKRSPHPAEDIDQRLKEAWDKFAKDNDLLRKL